MKPKVKKKVKQRPRAIRTLTDRHKGIALRPDSIVRVGGWLQGEQTYLWLGIDGRCYGTVTGHKLYRLAKAITRQFENLT